MLVLTSGGTSAAGERGEREKEKEKSFHGGSSEGAGELRPQQQDESLATYAPRLTKELGHVDWGLPAQQLSSLLRAHTPWPGMEAQWRGAPVKVLRAAVGAAGEGDAPGTIVAVERDRVRVRCGGGSALDLLELQRPGRRPLLAGAFANGERLQAGQRFT